MREIRKSRKLDDVLYDIRGPVLAEARRIEEEGFRVLKLNIGNPAPFGFDAPDEILHDVIINLQNAQGYVDSKGLFSARKAIMQHYQEKGLLDVGIEDIYIGNGVSELIVMAMQGLLDNGDEMLVPAPDYPPVDRCGEPGRGKARALPLRRVFGLVIPTSTISSRRSPRRRRGSSSSTRTIRPARSTPTRYSRLSSSSPLGRSSSSSPTRSMTRSSTMGRSTSRSRRSRTRFSRSPSTDFRRPIAPPASAPAGWFSPGSALT